MAESKVNVVYNFRGSKLGGNGHCMAVQLVCGMCIPVCGVVKVLVNGVIWDPHQKNPIGKSENPALPQKQGMCFNSVWCGFLETETQLLNGYIGCGVFVGSTAADSEFCGYVQLSANN